MHKQSGFTYIEVIIGLALFAITLAAVLPVFSQAGRNMAYAQQGHVAHLRAQRIMLIVRDNLTDGSFANAQSEVLNFSANRDDFPFTVWVKNGAGDILSFSGGNVSNADVQVSGFVGTQAMIVVVVWNEHGRIGGRAMGMV